MAAQKKPVYLTPQGLERHKEKLKHLKEVKRKEISEYMGSAIADGDLRESAAYDEARMLQSANEAKIADLEELINRAQLISDKEKRNGIDFGAKFRLVDEEGKLVSLNSLIGFSEDDDKFDFLLVNESNEKDKIEKSFSEESELSAKVLYKSKGDKVELDGRTYVVKENKMNFYYVGTHEADVFEGRFSDESEIGKKVQGKHKGDRFEHNGTIYEIVEFTFE